MGPQWMRKFGVNLCRFYTLFLLFEEGQSLNASALVSCATTKYLRWVPSWTRALEMSGFSGCAASELILLSDSSEMVLSLDDGSGSVQLFQQRCEPVVLTLVSPLSICGYRFQTAAGSDLQDPLGFALHGSMDGSNWLILHEEPNYNTTRSRSTTSDLFEIYVQNISLEEVSVQMIVFSTSAARAWAHEGPFLAAEYAIEEFQLLAAGAILDLYDAAVEVGPNFTIKRWGTTTSTSSTSTISSSSISSTSISSTSISTTSGTTTSTSTRTNTSSTTATFTSSSVTHSTSRSSTSTVSDTTSSWLSSTSTWPSSTSTFSTTSSATGTSSSSSTVSSSSSSSTTSTSTSTSSSSSSTSTSISTSTSATTSLTSTSRTYWTWTSRTWTWTGFSTTRTWVTWTWTSRTMTSTSTRTTSTTTTSSVSTTSTSTSSTSTSSTSTSSMSTSSTSTSSPSTTSTSTSWTSTSSTSSTTTSSTTSTVPSTSTRVTSTSSSATRTTGTASTSSTTSSTASTITMTSSITRSTSTSTISTTTRSITTSISSSTLTTTSSTPKRGLGSSYLRVDLGSPVMLQAFRFITSSGSIERDPVQFAVWGSADNVSWIPLYFQNDISAVPTTRSTPTAWYAISTTTTTSTTTTSTTTITVTTTTSSSSTSSSVLPFDEALQNALGNLEASKLSFLGLLDGLNTNSSTGVLAQRVDVQEDGTVLVGVAIAVPEDGSPVAFGYGNISVEVPSAILESLGAPGVAVMGLLPTTSPLFNLLNSSEGGMQSDILSLDLFANGTAMKDLVEPIQLTLVSDGSQPATCAYLDEQTKKWSTEGVSLVSVQNGTIICATSHLSIFGAILKSAFAALACSNAAAIFSEKGLRSLGSRLWIFEWSAILNWITLLLGASLMARARKADRKHQGAVEQIQLISALRHVDRLEKSRDVKGHHHDSIQALILDEVRFLFDTGPIRIAYSRMLRARLGLSLQELNKLYKHAGHTSVHKRAECFLREFENRHIGKRISFWYRMNCIWFSIFHPSPKTTCLVRTSVLLGKIYSGWALSAVFYGASSIAPGEEDGCTPVEGLLDQLVRAFTVSLISSAFGALPFVALVFFFYRLRKLRLSIRRAIFWSFLFCYTFLCVGVVCIFIASVSPSDATKWFYTSLIDLLMTWLLPVLVSAAVLMIMSFYWFESAKTSKRVGHEEASHPVLPWPSLESLQMYEVKMGSLEVLEYKVKKKKPFRVTCEVAGCPDTSQSFERMQDEGSYRVSQGVFTASEDNQLLFSVYHWKGKTPPKLRGRALIPVAHLLDDGFNGKLDVQLDGHSVPMNVQVFFHKPKRPQVPASALVLPSEWNMSMTATEDTDPHAVPVVQEEKVELPHAAEPPEAAEASQPAEPAEVADSVLVAVEEERLLGAENVVEVTVTVVEASAQPEVQVDEDYEELSVPSEPPPLCARGNLLARTVTEELITVDVDAELFDPKEEVAELSQPRRESAASQPRSFYPEAPELYQRGGTTPSVSFSEEIEVEVEQEVPRRDFGDPPPSVPRLSPLSSPLSTSRRSAGPSRVEIVEKVEDPGLRDLCSIAEQRRLTSLPTARGQAT